jgi:hypothetical protein
LRIFFVNVKLRYFFFLISSSDNNFIEYKTLFFFFYEVISVSWLKLWVLQVSRVDLDLFFCSFFNFFFNFIFQYWVD